MRVIKNTDTDRYWVFCPEKLSYISINRTGAFKIASVCACRIEEHPSRFIEDIKDEYTKRKRKNSKDFGCI